ncbi:hypothetical protein PAPHI01_1345 [Pancytospora philotis]|nr:hypothetical protein PAPHI01_1345 [Pancytospora philotis]
MACARFLHNFVCQLTHYDALSFNRKMVAVQEIVGTAHIASASNAPIATVYGKSWAVRMPVLAWKATLKADYAFKPIGAVYSCKRCIHFFSVTTAASDSGVNALRTTRTVLAIR